MSDNPTTTGPAAETPQAKAPEGPQTTTAGTPSASVESWQEVGKQFQQLGQSLAEALRATWYDEENRRKLQAMQTGLEAMVVQVGTAVKETAVTPAAQKTREGATKAVQGARVAGAQALQEARPHVLSALQSLNEELQRLISRMEQAQPAAGAGAPAPAAGTPAPQAPEARTVQIPVTTPAPEAPEAATPEPPAPPAPEAPKADEPKWWQQQ